MRTSHSSLQRNQTETSRFQERDSFTLTRALILVPLLTHERAFKFKFMSHSNVQRLGVSNRSGGAQEEDTSVVRVEYVANGDGRISRRSGDNVRTAVVNVKDVGRSGLVTFVIKGTNRFSSLPEKVSESSDKHEVREGAAVVMCAIRERANNQQRAGPRKSRWPCVLQAS